MSKAHYAENRDKILRQLRKRYKADAAFREARKAMARKRYNRIRRALAQMEGQ